MSLHRYRPCSPKKETERNSVLKKENYRLRISLWVCKTVMIYNSALFPFSPPPSSSLRSAPAFEPNIQCLPFSSFGVPCEWEP